MIKKSLIDDDSLWTALCYLENMQGQESIENICEIIEIEESKLLQVLHLLKSLNLDYEFLESGNSRIIKPPTEKVEINFSFNLSEWIALQSHFPAIDFYKSGAAHETLVNKLGEIERKNEQYDIFRAEEASSVSLQKALSDLEDDAIEMFEIDLKVLENAILKKSMVKVLFEHDRVSLFYPHRLIVLNNELSLIAEDTNDFSLTYISCLDIKDVTFVEDSYNPKFNSVEVNHFISGMRNLNDNEMRLVIKIFDPNIELDPPFQFLGRPYVALNWEGCRIWGVTVEPNDKLYEWLSELGNKVEVIDPPSFKEEYLSYLENRLKKSA